MKFLIISGCIISMSIVTYVWGDMYLKSNFKYSQEAKKIFLGQPYDQVKRIVAKNTDSFISGIGSDTFVRGSCSFIFTAENNIITDVRLEGNCIEN